MHMNCEGCEWELLEDLLQDPELVKKVVAVFFSNFPLLTKCLGKMFTNRCPLLPRGKTLKTRRHSYIVNSQWVANQNKRYCKIRERLRLTHKLAWGVPYAWERWDRLD